MVIGRKNLIEFVWLFFFAIGVIYSFHPAIASDSYILIDLKTKKLLLYKNNSQFKSYSIGVGRKKFPTPTGVYRVCRLLKNPAWQNPYQKKTSPKINHGNKNPLGTRWIGFKRDSHGEYGIHGTNNPSSVGKASSHGCVRMHISEAEELYTYVYQDMPVIIIDSGMEASTLARSK